MPNHTSTATGFAYKPSSYLSPLPSMGFDLTCGNYSKTLLITGLSLQPVFTSFRFNERNIDLKSIARSQYLQEGDYCLQLYLEAEKRLIKNSKAKNFFSLLLGVGFNYYYHRDLDSGLYLNQQAWTKTGEQLVGSRFGEVNHKVAVPSIITGIRYSIFNTKAKKLIIIELAYNYGIWKYFDHMVSYKIGGEQRVDYLYEKGLNIQLNISIPIRRFHSKKIE